MGRFGRCSYNGLPVLLLFRVSLTEYGPQLSRHPHYPSNRLTSYILYSRITARRRRALGQGPVWGTAWVPSTNFSQNNNYPTKSNQWQYDPNASTHQPGQPNPPPVYSPPGNYYAPPPGPPPQQYEMRSPYGPAPMQYNPPAGPPPGHQVTGTHFPPLGSPPPAHLQGEKA